MEQSACTQATGLRWSPCRQAWTRQGWSGGGCLGGGSGKGRSALGEGLGTVASSLSGLQHFNAGADTAAPVHTTLLINPMEEQPSILNSFSKDVCMRVYERTRRSL